MRATSTIAAAYSTNGFRAARFHSGALLLAVVIVLPCGTSSQQSPPSGGMSHGFPGTTSQNPISQDSPQATPFSDQYNPWETQKRLRLINTERQKAMVADTDKLLKLAKDLNEEIARSNSGELSQAQLRKVAEIEKLAHNVRDKMVMSIRGTQFNMDNPAPPYFSPPTR
jgi:hypothetical protein